MAQVGARQVLITVVLVVVAFIVVLPAAGPALRPAWLLAPIAGVPLSAWLLLIVILALLVGVRIIAAILFVGGPAGEERR